MNDSKKDWVANGKILEEIENKSLLNQFATFCKSDNKWQCKKCDKRVSRTATMLSHIRTRHNRVMYRCGKCRLTFHEKRLLIDHQQTHTVEKPFACNICHRRFQTIPNLRNHERYAILF